MSAAGGTLAAERRVERAERVAAARAAGVGWKEIAAAEGVSVSTVKRAARSGRALGAMSFGSVDGVDGDAVLLRVLRSHFALLGLAEQQAVSADNSNAKVGALRAAASIGRGLLEILVVFGLVRGHQGLSAYHRELRQMGEVVAALADRFELPDDAVDQAFEELAALRIEPGDAEVAA